MNNAVFLDRDGTINEDVGDFCSPDKLIFIQGSIEALQILQKSFLLFIITNQSGIARGIFSEDRFLWFNDYFNKILRNQNVIIRETYYCPHKKEDDCICHKPKPYFITKAQKEYNINLKNSYVIGDHPHDIEMAHKAGTHSIYLLSGHGKKHRQELLVEPDFIAQDLYEAASWIMEKSMINKQEVL